MASEEVAFINQDGFGGRLRRIGRSICNTEKGEFLSRTPGSWAKITVFYIFFYSCLAGFFAGLMAGFFTTLDPKAPTQRNMYSLLKGNPGMGFRPMPIVESTLIKFDSSNPKSYEKYIDNLNSFLKEYRNQSTGAHVVDCDDPDFNRTGSAVCETVHERLFGPCASHNGYGYPEGKPCVLLKINKVYGWSPVITNATDLNGIELTCEGENDPDHDLVGEVAMFPKNSFSVNWFPYLNQDDYRTPIVFASFQGVKKGVLIQIWCKMWAKNIKHHKNDKAGSVHFELMVD